MAEKSRIKNLSTRFLLFYKYGVVLLLSLFVLWIVWQEIQSSKSWSSRLYLPLVWSYLVFQWIKAHLKVYRVEFDDEFLYVLSRGQDLLIPLENIKDIEMKSLGGVWRVELFYADVMGDHFYFKPSLLYPLNYKSKDALVNLLWKKIEIAKGKKPEFQANALHS
jgi:hypothetical protein